MANENFTQFADGGVLQATDYLVGYRGGAEAKVLGSNILAYIESNALALVNGSTAYTQSPGDNSTKVATTAFVAAAAGGVTSITGTSGQVVASASTGAVTLSLPSTITGVTQITSLASIGTITTGIWNAGTVTNTQSIGAVSTDGFVLSNTTAAANGAQQWSPRLHLIGQGWSTGAGGASMTVDWIIENKPIQGSAAPTGSLVMSNQVNAGGYTAQATLTSVGGLTLAGGLVVVGAVSGVTTLGMSGALSGATTISNSSTITTTITALGTTLTNGHYLKNSTAATVGTQLQYSPALTLEGSAWQTGSGGFSQTDDWYIWNQPQAGSATATTATQGQLKIGVALSTNSAAPGYTDAVIITAPTVTGVTLSATSPGNLSVYGSLTANFGLNANVTTTSFDGVILQTTRAASSGGGVVRYSPRIRLTGAAWNSSGAASEIDSFIIENQPQTVAGTTTANLVISASIASGSYSAICTITSGGAMTLAGTIKTTAAVTYDFGAISNTSLAGLTALNLTRQAVITIGGTAYYFPCATSAQ